MLYGSAVLAGGIVGICLSSVTVFSLALLTFILFIAFLFTVIARSQDYDTHNHKVTMVSFAGLFAVVIVVFTVITEGAGLEGLDGGFIGHDNVKKNPYDFVKNYEI